MEKLNLQEYIDKVYFDTDEQLQVLSRIYDDFTTTKLWSISSLALELNLSFNDTAILMDLCKAAKNACNLLERLEDTKNLSTYRDKYGDFAIYTKCGFLWNHVDRVDLYKHISSDMSRQAFVEEYQGYIIKMPDNALEGLKQDYVDHYLEEFSSLSARWDNKDVFNDTVKSFFGELDDYGFIGRSNGHYKICSYSALADTVREYAMDELVSVLSDVDNYDTSNLTWLFLEINQGEMLLNQFEETEARLRAFREDFEKDYSLLKYMTKRLTEVIEPDVNVFY